MGTIYRDYGYIPGSYAPQNEFDVIMRGQVYQATHGGDDSRLPFMNRSFISFSFGGKDIEEFDLIATTTNNRLNRTGYASFADNTSTYDNLDGQQYWGTHYRNNSMTFTLSTDGIDQQKLDEFLYWFRPGETRELILAEHPNRVIYARVSDPPTLNLLPFEGTTDMVVDNSTYLVHTTLYKGDITLNLVMDYPFWHAKDNLLGRKITGENRYEDKWLTPDGEWVDIFSSKDALKVLYEDGIPLGSMIQTDMLLGNGAYATYQTSAINQIWSLETVTYTSSPSGGIWVPASGTGARIAPNDNDRSYGLISGAIVDASGNGIGRLENASSGGVAYFFYAGTAPSPTIISFSMIPTLNGSGYITAPRNSTVHSSNPFNTITITGQTEQSLKLTTPNLFTSYNVAIKALRSGINYSKIEEFRGKLRDSIHHSAVRAWAIKVVDFAEAFYKANSNTALTTADLVEAMSAFISPDGNLTYPASFSFNSANGEALGTFSYKTVTSSMPNNMAGWSTYGTLKQNQVEDVGDMLLSNYIYIRERNYPRKFDGQIMNWQNSTEGKSYSHKITHNFGVALTNVSILYENLYL